MSDSEFMLKSGLLNCRILGNRGSWNLSGTVSSSEKDVHIFKWKLCSSEPASLPELKISFHVTQKDIQVKWRPSYGRVHHYFPFWWDGGQIPASLTQNAPVFSYMNLEGINRLTFALSDAQRTSYIHSGPTESDGVIVEIKLFSVPEAPVVNVEFSLRVDLRRDIKFADALKSVSEWYEAMPEYSPAEVPRLAQEPMYSTWYQYQREISAELIERELDDIRELGMKTIILDDGWQMGEKYPEGETYSKCGSWIPASNKFPDMRWHVQKCHDKGISYMIWFAVPFVGIRDEIYEKFKSKFLYEGSKNTYVLDPRFPEVREYTIQIYEKAVRDWGIDGLKLDFIDSFHLTGRKDPALEDNYAGRDIKSVSEAVDRMLTDTITRLKEIRSDIMIEFRQQYIGPAIRKYGNIFRAADCAMDMLENRVRTIDLRLLSGNTAVHSDMIIWSPDETAETAALQILNVIFSTVQVSVLLEKLSDSHKKMLKFWLNFCVEHKDTLLKGKLLPEHPELSYPVVRSYGKSELITAVYESDKIIRVHQAEKNIIINASHSDKILLDMNEFSGKISVYNVFGEECSRFNDGNRLIYVDVPQSGFIEIIK